MGRLLFAVVAAVVGPLQAGERPHLPFYANKTDLLFAIDAEGKLSFVRTPADWQTRRTHILASMELVMGPVPNGAKRVPLDVETVAVAACEGCG